MGEQVTQEDLLKITDTVEQAVEHSVSLVVHRQLLPVLQSIANQVAEIWEHQQRMSRELKWVRGRLDSLEVDFQNLRDEHKQCPHCGKHGKSTAFSNDE
jgi:uncharacterized coiled-coil protein SlyX